MPNRYMNATYPIIARAFARPGQTFHKVKVLSSHEESGTTIYQIVQFLPVVHPHLPFLTIGTEIVRLYKHGIYVRHHKESVAYILDRFVRRVVEIETFLSLERTPNSPYRDDLSWLVV